MSLKAMRLDERAALRERILDVASELIAAEGGDALSMRKLAHALNCPPMSLYRYFDDKHALLLGLAQRSFFALARRFEADIGGEPLSALYETFRLYARFGLDHPAEYRTMFMTPEAQPQRSKDAADLYKENPAYAFGVDRASACVEAGRLAGEPNEIATLLWTNVHGAVAAMLCLPAFPFGDPEAYFARVIDLTLSAFRLDTSRPSRQNSR